MKPGDHPEFFRLPPPDGRSRESTIRVDRHGGWFHDGAPVEHRGLAAALPTWVARHPDDARWILSNGYDWCYFEVEATPFFVVRFEVRDGTAWLWLSDGSESALAPESLCIDDDEVLRCTVKAGAFEARFSRHAQLGVAPWLRDTQPLSLELGGVCYPIR